MIHGEILRGGRPAAVMAAAFGAASLPPLGASQFAGFALFALKVGFIGI